MTIKIIYLKYKNIASLVIIINLEYQNIKNYIRYIYRNTSICIQAYIYR